MTTPADEKLKRTRRFRRLRYEFKTELSAKKAAKGEKAPKLSRADRVLVDMCALLSLRAQQMRDAILDGEQVADEDVVRAANAAIRTLKTLEQRKAQQTAATDDDWQTALYSMGRKKDDEEETDA